MEYRRGRIAQEYGRRGRVARLTRFRRFRARSHSRMNPAVLRQQMGHSSAVMTARYTGEIPLDKVQEAFSKMELENMGGDSDEGDRGSGLMVISVPGSNRSVVGAKRRWQLDFVESDHDRQACCC